MYHVCIIYWLVELVIVRVENTAFRVPFSTCKLHPTTLLAPGFIQSSTSKCFQTCYATEDKPNSTAAREPKNLPVSCWAWVVLLPTGRMSIQANVRLTSEANLTTRLAQWKIKLLNQSLQKNGIKNAPKRTSSWPRCFLKVQRNLRNAGGGCYALDSVSF